MNPNLIILLAGPVLALVQTPAKVPQLPTVASPPDVLQPLLTGAPIGSALTLDTAVELAQRTQPNVLAAAASAAAARARTRGAASGLGPQVTLGASGTKNTLISGAFAGGAQGGWNEQANANLTQLLYDFGRVRSALEQQRLADQAAAEALEAARSDTSLAVRQAFHGLILARRLAAIAEQNFASRKMQRDLARARVEEGVGAPGDLVQAQSALSDAAIQIANARNAANLARIGLCIAIGIDSRTPIDVQDSVEEAPSLDVDALTRTALDARPEARRALSLVRSAEAGLSTASKGNAPSLNLGASYTSRGVGEIDANRSTSLGITMNWPVFDSGLVRARREENRALVDSAKSLAVQVRQQVSADVSQALSGVATAQQLLSLTADQLAIADEFLRINTGRYRGGVGTFLDLVTAQDAATNAQRNRAQADFALEAALATLRHAVGKP